MIPISLEGFILESFWLDEVEVSEHMGIFTSTKVFLYQSECLECYKGHQSKQSG